MILRPDRPQSPSGPPTPKLPVGLTRKSDDLEGIHPLGSADSTAVEIISLTRPGVYFLLLRLFSLCCVETTTLVQPTGLPSTYFTVTWLLASGFKLKDWPERRFSESHFRLLWGKNRSAPA